MERIHLQQTDRPKAEELDVEIVERKGLGHPDTICDAIVEEVSQALARAYLEQTGAVLHYNCDKAMLVAGRVEHQWRGGAVIDPMRLIIGDRATSQCRGQEIDIGGIAIDAARGWIRRHLRHVDAARHMQFELVLKPGSPALGALYARGVVGANDTSAAVGYAPMSETEQLVLEAERYANSPSFKTQFPETGEDMKVMGIRAGRHLHLTMAMPLIDRYLASERDYFDRKPRVFDAINGHLRSSLRSIDDVSLTLNAIDHAGAGFDGVRLPKVPIRAKSGAGTARMG